MIGQVSFSTDQIKAAMAGEEVAKKPPPAPVVKQPSLGKLAAPTNVVALAKARLRDVKKELRRMKALEKERDELERLVAAAERKPKTVLREVKTTAG